MFHFFLAETKDYLNLKYNLKYHIAKKELPDHIFSTLREKHSFSKKQQNFRVVLAVSLLDTQTCQQTTFET